MNPNKALWEKGDFTRIAQSMRESGEALVKSLAFKSTLRASRYVFGVLCCVLIRIHNKKTSWLL